MFLLFLIFVGVLMVIVNERVYSVPTRVEYRYLPRDLDTYLRETTHAHVPFAEMNEEDPFWTRHYA
jgi:hypothetical protein